MFAVADEIYATANGLGDFLVLLDAWDRIATHKTTGAKKKIKDMTLDDVRPWRRGRILVG